MPFPATARRDRTALALGLIFLATVISACSSSSSSSAPQASPSGSTAAQASPSGTGSSSAATEIPVNWSTFFAGSTPASKRAQLLQNGSQFSSSLSAIAASPLNSGVTIKVDSVTLTSPSEATVKYDLSALGLKVASGATGTAVFQNGTWKVGDTVFCGLLTQAKSDGLSLPVPAACSSAA